MTREKIKLPIPVIVEGRYDKSKLSEILDCQIITTNGFGIFNHKEKLALIKRLSENGVVVLTDSDGAGSVIRGHLKSALPKDKVYNLYIPKIEGKEKRKKTASKEGTLGVEGMETDLLYSLFSDFADKHIFNTDSRNVGGITKADFFEVGITGSDGSGERRNEMAKFFGLPSDMTPNALLGALNLLTDKNGFFSAAESLWAE
jgi:ribonuclease M5